jgi:hypothetical protein
MESENGLGLLFFWSNLEPAEISPITRRCGRQQHLHGEGRAIPTFDSYGSMVGGRARVDAPFGDEDDTGGPPPAKSGGVLFRTVIHYSELIFFLVAPIIDGSKVAGNKRSRKMRQSTTLGLRRAEKRTCQTWSKLRDTIDCVPTPKTLTTRIST